jgi:hypothetical protein
MQRCGARCRDGHTCQSPAARDASGRVLNGRCSRHGGMSTGPKTAEGRARCGDALRAFWARYRAWARYHAEHPSVVT